MNLSRNVTKRPGNENTIIQEETFPAAEKILYDIENILRKDPELTSFEIIPVQDSENKSPVYHEEHSLGLASWCIQPLYCYAYGRLIDLRRSDYRREDPATISRWLMGALLLNPDVSTFWNMKRELVRNGRLDAMSELRFSAVVLFYKAKCFEAFAYRRWIVQYLLVGGKTPNLDVSALLRNEISVAGISADRYANNYHAWSHREQIVDSHEKNLPDSYESLLKSEWDKSGKWCNRHVSDHSGLAYRQFILKRLMFQGKNVRPETSLGEAEIAERREFVVRLIISSLVPNELAETRTEDSYELLNILHNSRNERRADVEYDRTLVALSYWAEDCKSNESQILLYPGHEALWYHRRFLAHALGILNRSYRRESRYEFENFTKNSVKVGKDDTVRMKNCTVASLDKKNETDALLSLVFIQDNERLISLAQTHESQSQMKLGENFLKYIREFNLELLAEER